MLLGALGAPKIPPGVPWAHHKWSLPAQWCSTPCMHLRSGAPWDASHEQSLSLRVKGSGSEKFETAVLNHVRKVRFCILHSLANIVHCLLHLFRNMSWYILDWLWRSSPSCFLSYWASSSRLYPRSTSPKFPKCLFHKTLKAWNMTENLKAVWSKLLSVFT